MKRIVLCTNPQRDENFNLTRQVYEMLQTAGLEPVFCPLFKKYGIAPIAGFARVRELSEVLPDADMLITFGGDGTLLYVARAAAGYEVPILGVNLGAKGFIAEVERGDTHVILKAIAGECSVERRMMLDISIMRGGETIYSDCALNDVVVRGITRVIDISLFADSHKVLRYSGDGVIVATPTGTTAYSMAAGGPIVEPSAENIIITPICAHILFTRAFVLSPERTVRIETENRAGHRAYVSVDGTEEVAIKAGDVIKVLKSVRETQLIKISDDSFYEKVFKKLGERK
jgi:NAD+ kinase